MASSQILEMSHVSEAKIKDVTGRYGDLWDVLEAQPLTTLGIIEILYYYIPFGPSPEHPVTSCNIFYLATQCHENP
jgi:hypothetical protein